MFSCRDRVGAPRGRAVEGLPADSCVRRLDSGSSPAFLAGRYAEFGLKGSEVKVKVDLLSFFKKIQDENTNTNKKTK